MTLNGQGRLVAIAHGRTRPTKVHGSRVSRHQFGTGKNPIQWQSRNDFIVFRSRVARDCASIIWPIRRVLLTRIYVRGFVIKLLDG